MREKKRKRKKYIYILRQSYNGPAQAVKNVRERKKKKKKKKERKKNSKYFLLR